MTQLYIDGRTSLYALVGHYTGFSPVTGLFNAISSYIGYNAIMVPFGTEHSELQKMIEALKVLHCRGIFVDTPHRCVVGNLVASFTEEAASCEAVNLIRFDEDGYRGHNTEISAFKKAYQSITGENLTNKRIFIIGSGGIARAAAIACVQEQCTSLTIAGRNADKCQHLCNLVNHVKPNTGFIADYNHPETIHNFYNADIIIQATSSGMFPDLSSYPLPEDYHLMSHHLVLDTVYNPPQTRMMQLAEEVGCRFYNGRDIMFYACLDAFQWWTDVRIDLEGEKKLFHIWNELLYNV